MKNNQEKLEILRKTKAHNRGIRLKEMANRLRRRRKQKQRQSNLTANPISEGLSPEELKIEIEKQKAKRDAYFSQALSNIDTSSFMKLWDKTSKDTRDEVLDFSAKSFGAIDGFDLANRAIQGPLKMQQAGIDTNIVIDQAEKVAKIAFFDLILKKSELDVKWHDSVMSFFIAKEMGVNGAKENDLKSLIDKLSNFGPPQTPESEKGLPNKRTESSPSLEERSKQRRYAYRSKSGR